MKLYSSRALGFIVITAIYIAAFWVGVFIFNSVANPNIFVKLVAADIAATIVVWLAGVLLKNSSVYDPYWSVAPIVIVIFIIDYYGGFNAGNAIMFSVVVFWGIRLTLNWAYTFKNLKTQDWRYDKFKNENPSTWFYINLFGINLIPTFVVFLAITPSILFVKHFAEVNAGLIFAALICLTAALIQFFSDFQMHKFRKACSKGINNKGLWKLCRHPNYLGEILMWWGVYFMLLSVSIDYWYMFFAPLANNIMFLVISIPLMEQRQLKNKPEYSDYIQTTGKLLPKINL